MRRFFIIILTVAFVLQIDAQIKPPEFIRQIGNESYVLFTDRTVYCTGETVYFSVFPVKNQVKDHDKLLSLVYYVDIVNEDGRIIGSGKFPLKESGTHGGIFIPEALTAGHYLLRSYTKWMRNYDAGDFQYIPLVIINPFQPLKARSINKEESFQIKKLSDSFLLKTDKKSYSRRDSIHLSIERPGAYEAENSLPFSVSIVKKGLLDLNYYQLKETNRDLPVLDQPVFFLPETRGISLTGHTENYGINKNPIRDQIYLSILDGEGELIPAFIDSTGSFNFQLPDIYGRKELYMYTKNPDEKISIDNDLASVPWPMLSFQNDTLIPDETVDLYSEISRNYQFRKIYFSKKEAENVRNDIKDYPEFYGKPDYSFVFDNYIALGTTEDYFYEIIHYLRLKNIGKEKELFIFDKSGKDLGNNPLVLINMTPGDINNVLSIHPSRIEKIDLINQKYIRGDVVFDGILSVKLKDENLTDIDFEENGVFFKYNFFEPQTSFSLPEIEKDDPRPDLRNTLYWNPALRLSNGNRTIISIPASDIVGDYIVVVRAINTDGSLVQSQTDFIIK